MEKQIANIVFYKFWGERGEMEQACIFYEDGTVKNTSMQEGLAEATKLAQAARVTKNQFEKMINTDRIYALSGENFERRFKEFLGKGVALAPAKKVSPVINHKPKAEEEDDDLEAQTTSTKNNSVPQPPRSTSVAGTGNNVPPVVPAVTPEENPEEAEEEYDDTNTASSGNKKKKSLAERIADRVNNNTKGKKKSKKNKKKKKKNKKSLWQRFKESKVGKRVTAFCVAAALLAGGITGFFLGRNTKDGDIINNNIGNLTDVTTDNTELEAQDLAYAKLINETSNESLKNIMKRQGENLDIFNRDFALAHIEDGKDIQAALSWDEMIALNLAYNNYTKEEIALMFNGSEVDSKAMTDAYKNAILQLMGAYVIETREEPVNSSKFINSEEGQAFVEKYNNLFLKCKETTGAEQITAINAFYAELYKDFPITDEQRVLGISHADDRNKIESYKLAIVPIVNASEIMFQNKGEIDHTMSDKAVAYFNDLALCNLAEEQFERAQIITLSTPVDESVPTYEEYRTTKIKELEIEENYVIDDEHRDLSRLSEFQKWVNGGNTLVESGQHSNGTTTNQPSETHTTTTSDRDEAISQAGQTAVKNAEEKADQAVQTQNQAAKQEGENEAEKKRQELQNAADQEASDLQDEVTRDDQDMQDKINAANNNGANGTINEENFGDHNVNFDNEHSDENGNLDDSVKDITTNGDGAVNSGEPLPDPNETADGFVGGNTETTEPSEGEFTYGDGFYETEEPYTGGTSMTNEQIVNAYIAMLDGQGTTEAANVYVKK